MNVCFFQLNSKYSTVIESFETDNRAVLLFLYLFCNLFFQRFQFMGKNLQYSTIECNYKFGLIIYLIVKPNLI